MILCEIYSFPDLLVGRSDETCANGAATVEDVNYQKNFLFYELLS